MTTARDATPELLWGVNAMAQVIGRSDRVTFHLVQKGEIPARKVGGRWVIERSKLIAAITGEDA